jgi:hypothetical protein
MDPIGPHLEGAAAPSSRCTSLAMPRMRGDTKAHGHDLMITDDLCAITYSEAAAFGINNLEHHLCLPQSQGFADNARSAKVASQCVPI